MILQDSNFKLKKGFRLGIITGVKKSRDQKTNLATIHVKLVDGLSLRKTTVKPKNCPICGPRAFCNLVTSSRNACLLEPCTNKNALETAGGSRNITSISLPNIWKMCGPIKQRMFSFELTLTFMLSNNVAANEAKFMLRFEFALCLISSCGLNSWVVYIFDASHLIWLSWNKINKD